MKLMSVARLCKLSRWASEVAVQRNPSRYGTTPFPEDAPLNLETSGNHTRRFFLSHGGLICSTAWRFAKPWHQTSRCSSPTPALIWLAAQSMLIKKYKNLARILWGISGEPLAVRVRTIFNQASQYNICNYMYIYTYLYIIRSKYDIYIYTYIIYTHIHTYIHTYIHT